MSWSAQHISMGGEGGSQEAFRDFVEELTVTGPQRTRNYLEMDVGERQSLTKKHNTSALRDRPSWNGF